MQPIEAIERDLKLRALPLTPDYDCLAVDLRAHKEAALKRDDQVLAKRIWCLEHTILAHTTTRRISKPSANSRVNSTTMPGAPLNKWSLHFIDYGLISPTIGVTTDLISLNGPS